MANETHFADGVKTPWYNAYKSIGIPETVDYPRETIYESMCKVRDRLPKGIALDFMGRKITFSQMLEMIDTCADALTKSGIGKGDVVSICLPNIPQAVAAFYAVNRVGARSCMIHPMSTPNEIEAFAIGSGSVAIFALDFFFPGIAKILPNTKIRKSIVCSINTYFKPITRVGFRVKMRKRYRPIEYSQHVMKWDEFMELGSPQPFVRVAEPDDCASILYSGGTSTGEPKGIMLSNMNFVVLAYNLVSFVKEIEAGDSMLTILPMFHGFGLGICVNGVLTLGMTSIIVPQFSAELFIGTIKKKKPSFIAGVPSMYQTLISSDKAKDLDFSFLKAAFAGGDSVPPALKKQFNDFMYAHNSNVTLREGYGLTEIVTACAITPQGSDKLDSMGIPFPTTLVKVVEYGTTIEMPLGANGELCIHGPQVMLGYMNSPEENDMALRTHADGRIWLHTGDLGMIDEEGNMYFRQRIKRIIKCSGYPVYPSLVEDCVMGFEGVHQCCAIGVDDDYSGQRVKVFIVMKDKEDANDVTRGNIVNHCRTLLNKWSVPREVEFRDELPLTKVGKVDIVSLTKEEHEKRRML